MELHQRQGPQSAGLDLVAEHPIAEDLAAYYPLGEIPFGESPFGESPFGESPFGESPFGESPV